MITHIGRSYTSVVLPRFAAGKLIIYELGQVIDCLAARQWFISDIDASP